MNAAPDLNALLLNRSWLEYRKPFTHIYAQDVFKKEFYDTLADQFSGWLHGKSGQKSAFNAGSGWYQAQTYYPDDTLSGPFAVFASHAWHEMITGMFDFSFTNDVHIEMHHHPKGNGSGWAHNDLNPGWFVGTPRADGITMANEQLCAYRTGKCSAPNEQPRETMRGVALLFYLANPAWVAGDGGETGLYLRNGTPVEQPDRAVAPINNSLLAFECTPYSYHSFINNRTHPRNSMIMWFHRPKEDVQRRWGDHSIVYWKNS